MVLAENLLNRTKSKGWYSMTNRADGSGPAKIYIYDEISWAGVAASAFVRELNEIKNDEIDLHLNTPGGSVFDGLAIFNALKSHPANINVYIDGLAASIGSVIALAGDKIHIAENAFIMVHNVSGLAYGDSAEMRRVAELLDKITGQVVKIYVKNSEKTEKEIISMMSDETWLDAEEAVKAGFASGIFNGEETDAKFDLSMFSNTPSSLNSKEDDSGLPETEREFEHFLRDAGYSRKEAKKISAKGFGSQEQRDADDDDSFIKEAEKILMGS